MVVVFLGFDVWGADDLTVVVGFLVGVVVFWVCAIATVLLTQEISKAKINGFFMTLNGFYD